MVEVKRRVLELFDGKQSLFFPQIQTIKGDWTSITNGEKQDIAFDNLATANAFLSKMPKQSFFIHEYVAPVEELKPVGEA